ncbi:fibronectin type III domain-containing protein [Candidatus Falkowbacteria bacterium]|nr:fibronectin type III domain-containing protein [Candidatus Falkowbacteria bacterium]
MKKLLIFSLVCAFALTGLTVSAARPPKKGGPSLPAPSNFDATTVSNSEIDLTWQDNSDNEDGFKIERGLDGQSFSQIDTVSANVTSYEDTGLSDETTYYYRVRAYKRKNKKHTIHSDYSNTTSTTTYASSTPSN